MFKTTALAAIAAFAYAQENDDFAMGKEDSTATVEAEASFISVDNETMSDAVVRLTTKAEVEEKPAYVPIDTSNYKLEEFTLAKMLGAAQDDSVFADFVEEAKESWMSHWRAREADLPTVCEKGKACRLAIQEEARRQIRIDWEARIGRITKTLETFGTKANDALAAAYDAAFDCAHGCNCQHIETQYTFLVSQIKKFEGEIVELNDRSDVILQSIANVNDECDFSVQANNWAVRKAELDTEWQAELDAVKAWDQDDWEMEDVIDQAKFVEDEGFRYESDIFDKYTAEQVQAAQIANTF